MLQIEKGRLVHLCQGYEGDISYYAQLRSEIEALYRTPMLTLTIHEPLTQLLWERFKKKACTVGQGINHRMFQPAAILRAATPMRVLLVGPYEVDLKGIRQGLMALKTLKQEFPLQVIRVSQFPQSREEQALGVTDEYHHHLRAAAMPEVYRSCDVVLVPSWANEGFGLPAIEAMACGVPTVLSAIPSFRALAPRSDWTMFFPERDSQGMQDALRKLLSDVRLRGDTPYPWARSCARVFVCACGRTHRTSTDEWRYNMSMHDPKRAVLLCRSATVASEEWAWGNRLCEELLRGKERQEQVLVLDQSQPVTVGAALAATSAQHLGIVLDDRMLWGLPGWDSLQAILDSANHIAAIAPVSNEARATQQKVTPPFLYSTPSLLRQAAHAHYQQYCQQWSEVAELDPFAFLVRRTALNRLDSHLPVAQIPQALASQGGCLAIALTPT